jgi:hypothetical protein
MRQFLTVIVLLGTFAIADAQKPPIKYGDIPDEVLKMTSFPPDSTAEAVVLADYGESTIVYNNARSDFQIVFERTRRIKILTEAGKKWADFGFRLYKDSDQAEKLGSFKGVTVNLENGKAVETKLKSDAVFREKYNKNIEIVKVTLPNVKVGSVIDINYRIISDFLFNFQDWEFQSTIPVVWSEYRAAVPEYFIYDKYMEGYIPVSINDHEEKSRTLTATFRDSSPGPGGRMETSTQTFNYKEDNFRWVAKDVPAFHDEPFMTTRNDFISRMNFELATIKMPGSPIRQVTGSWQKINELFAESDDFLGEVRSNSFLNSIVNGLVKDVPENAKKIEAIHNYVRQSVTWDGENRMFTERSLQKVLSEKKGSAAEINLLLASMIEKAGLTVKPVLLSTRDHGFIREATPATSQFNYVICLVRWENTQLLLDATEPYLPMGLLPSRCLNGKGMAVAKEGPEWIALQAPKGRVVTDSDLALSPEGVLTGTLKREHGGYPGQERRTKYFGEGQEGYVKEMVGTRQWQVSNSQFTNAKELREPFKEVHDIAINEHITIAGDVMYMNPFISGQWSSNPFKSEKREYPVDFGNAFDEVYVLKIKLPPGYEVDEMPATKVFALPANAARYTMSSSINGGVLSITSMLTVNKVMFTSLEYHALREFCNQVVAKQTEQIVIKKKQ